MYNTLSKCPFHSHEEHCKCSASSSLVDLETYVIRASMMSAPQSRFFQGMEDEREKILRVLVENDTGQNENRIRRMSDCCSIPHVIATKHDLPVLVVGRCKDRMCPRCSRHNAFQMSKRLELIISRMNSRRMITFTLKHRDGSLKSQIDRLMESWKKIRKTDLWKEHVLGGIYSLEVQYDEIRKNWHPHLHVVVEGSYFDQKVLSKLWEKVTGDSPIVDIRAVYSVKQTGRYISKYVTKPDEVATWSNGVLWEYMQAIKGRRLFHTFGALHNIKIIEKREKIEQRAGAGYASIAALILGYRAGVVECLYLWAHLRFMPRSWRLAFGISDDEAGVCPGFEGDQDMKKLSDLFDAASKAIRPDYKPPRPEPPPVLRLFNLWPVDDTLDN